jgi:dephospho-CoA kinase
VGLRVGLTGGLGSGKSTVLRMLVELGAHGLSADELGRTLMHPGTQVFRDIAEHFGPNVVTPDGTLNRAELARLAFAEGRVEELNAIIHPATIARQGEIAAEIFAKDPNAIVVVESALIFETKYGDGWRERFDKLILIAAPEALKVERFVARSGAGDRFVLEAEARRRLAQMIPDEVKAPQCDFILRNDGTVEELKPNVEALWRELHP